MPDDSSRLVLFIQNSPGLDGSGASLLLLIEQLVRQGDRALVLLPRSGPLVAQLERLGAGVEFAPLNQLVYSASSTFLERRLGPVSPWSRFVDQSRRAFQAACAYPAHARLLERLLRKHHPDLIHVNEQTLLVPGLAARRLGLPLVWHVRSMLSDSVWGRCSGWIIPRAASRVIAVSRAAAGRLDQSGGRVQVIYNGVDLSRFDPSLPSAPVRSAFDIPPQAALIGFIGRLAPAKGIFDLIAAMPAILAQVPQAHFLLVGSFNSALNSKSGWPDPRSLIEQQGLSGRVHLAGVRADVPALLAAMDVVALPTWTEGFGRTIIEALAMRKPVVSTQVDAIPELIEDGRSGLLVPPRDPRALAQAVVRFLHDPTLSASCAALGCELVRERFSSQRCDSALAQVYAGLLASRSAAQPAGWKAGEQRR